MSGAGEIGEIEFTSLTTRPHRACTRPSEETLEKPERINRFWVWERPIEAAEYYVSADVGGEGEGNDFSDCCVYRLEFGSRCTQVAEWHGRINASHFAKVVAAIGIWYNESEIAVEYARTASLRQRAAMDDRLPQPLPLKRLDKIGNTLTQHTHWLTNAQTATTPSTVWVSGSWTTISLSATVTRLKRCATSAATRARPKRRESTTTTIWY